MPPQDALVLDNLWPETTYLRVRRGSASWASEINDAPVALAAGRWRIVPHAPYRGDAVFMGQIAMASSAGGANLCTGGTPFGTNLTGTIANCFTGNLADFCNGSADTGDTATFGYAFASAVTIREVRLTSTTTAALFNQMPIGFTLQASTDGGTTWTSQYIVTGITPWASGGQTQTFTFSPVTITTGLGRGNAIGWRLNATTDNGAGEVALSELIFATTAGGPAITGGGFTCSASHNAFLRPALQAFDGSLSTIWSTNNNVSGRIGRIFSARGNIAEVRAAPDGGRVSSGPQNFTIQYTEDGVNWVTVLTQTGVSGWVASTYKTFAVP